jgi:hypothetical protein
VPVFGLWHPLWAGPTASANLLWPHCFAIPSQAPCAAGLYGVGGSSTACFPCLAGRFASSVGATAPQCSGPCSAGYVCAAGSVSPTAAECPAGTFSLAGAGACTVCPSATPYSLRLSTSVAACTLCTTGCESGLHGIYGANGPLACVGVASGWAQWVDTSSFEGGHSCLKYFGTSATWATANTACRAIGPTVHLLTSRQVCCGVLCLAPFPPPPSRPPSLSTSFIPAPPLHHVSPLCC